MSRPYAVVRSGWWVTLSYMRITDQLIDQAFADCKATNATYKRAMEFAYKRFKWVERGLK